MAIIKTFGVLDRWIERQVPATGNGAAMAAPLCQRGGGAGGMDVGSWSIAVAIAIRGRTLTPALLGR